MRFNKKEAEESVGIDIGSHFIKIVSLRKEQEGNTLIAYNIKKIPGDAKSSQKSQFVKEALEEIDMRPERVNLSISGPDVIARFIDLPKMSKEQLANALAFEAEKYIPFNISEVVLDSLIIDNKTAEPGQMTVLIAAAKREFIDTLIHMAEELGFSINVIDLDPFAMFNAFISSSPTDEELGNAFVIMGYSRIDVMVAIGQRPCFVRQIQIGSKDIIGSISKEMSVSVEDAENYIFNTPEEVKEDVAKASEIVLEDIVKEMQLSLGYFENRYGMSINRIYCSGGMVYQNYVLKYLSNGLGIAAKEWNPLENVKISDTISKDDIMSVSSQLAVSIGLALRE